MFKWFKWIRITNGFDQMLEGKVKSVFYFCVFGMFQDTLAKEKGKFICQIRRFEDDVVVVFDYCTIKKKQAKITQLFFFSFFF